MPMENQLLHEIVSDGNGHRFAAIDLLEELGYVFRFEQT